MQGLWPLPLLSLAVAALVIRSVPTASLLGLHVERPLAWALFTLLVATTIFAARALARPWTRKGRDNRRWIASAVAFLVIGAWLTGAVRLAGLQRPRLWTESSFGPLTVWPGVSFTAPGIEGHLTLGHLLLLGASSFAATAAVQVAIARRREDGRSRRGLLGLAGTGPAWATACPGCLPVAGLVLVALFPAIPAPPPHSPWVLLRDLVALVVPLVALAFVSRGRAARAARAPQASWRARAAPIALATVVMAPAAQALAGMPDGASQRQDSVAQLYLWSLVASTVLVLVVIGLLVGFTWRYRVGRGSERDPTMSTGARRLVQSLYIVIPTLVIFGLGVFSHMLFLQHEEIPEDATHIDVVANRFAWRFTYPDGSSDLNELRVREGETVVLNISSPDVVHSLFIPDMGVKTDAMPGTVNQAWFRATQSGTYDMYCTEYCGVGHADMRASLVVLPADAPSPVGREGTA